MAARHRFKLVIAGLSLLCASSSDIETTKRAASDGSCPSAGELRFGSMLSVLLFSAEHTPPRRSGGSDKEFSILPSTALLVRSIAVLLLRACLKLGERADRSLNLSPGRIEPSFWVMVGWLVFAELDFDCAGRDKRLSKSFSESTASSLTHSM